jgi:hypothetical protein
MTNTEQYKLDQLRRRFTIKVNEPTADNIASVTLSGCWRYPAFSVDEALDKCLTSILKNAYRDDTDVKANYANGLVGLNTD